MHKLVLKVVMLCCVMGLFSFTACAVDAETKVHRNAQAEEVVAELFVTSW